MATLSSILAWRIPWREATVHGVPKRWKWLKRMSKHAAIQQILTKYQQYTQCLQHQDQRKRLSEPINCSPLACVTEKAMAPHSRTLAWKIPWTEEPGGLQSMGSWRVGHDWVTSLSLFTFMHWRRKWQPTPVFLPGESQGWGHTVSDTTEVT